MLTTTPVKMDPQQQQQQQLPYPVSPPRSSSNSAITPQTSPKSSSPSSSPSSPSDERTLVDGLSGPLVSKMLDSKHLKNASTEELLSFMNFLKNGVSPSMTFFKQNDEDEQSNSYEKEGMRTRTYSGFEDGNLSRRSSIIGGHDHTTKQQRPDAINTDPNAFRGMLPPAPMSAPQEGHYRSYPLQRSSSSMSNNHPMHGFDHEWSDNGSYHSPSRPIQNDSNYRYEVESTLHKTLEMDYFLTLRELKSYKNLADTAALEYRRAFSAMEEAEKIFQERRKDLEIAIQERSELMSITKYLSSRIDSMEARLKDGNQRLIRLGMEPVAKAKVSGSDSCKHGDHEGHHHHHHHHNHAHNDQHMPRYYENGSQILRRNSEPEFSSFLGPEPPCDMMPGMMALNEQMNLKRTRTISPNSEDSKTFVETMSTSSKGFAESISNLPVSAPGSAMGSPDRKAIIPACVFYQGGQCNGSVCGHKSPHACIRCNDNHPAILCKKDRNVCVKWNMDVKADCGTTCQREHRCLRCASTDHTLRSCPIRPLGANEYCFAWNSAGTCRIVDCRRSHECIRCGTSHPAIICPENLDQYLWDYHAKCRQDGVHQNDLLQLEILINRRSAVASTLLNAASTQGPRALANGSAPSVAALAGSLGAMARSNGVQPHPLHLAAAAIIAATGDEAGPVDPERASKRIRSDDSHAMILTGFRTSHGSMLSESERKLICRDYNNFKCEVDDGKLVAVSSMLASVVDSLITVRGTVLLWRLKPQ
ncbi:hypothetical protein HDU97_007472 [Phlyctochytrium planicorne]|nr:hypothetical protein HDU97_007472 [Phlyctochytrium planicorne]